MPEGDHPKTQSMIPKLIGQVLDLLEADLSRDGYDLLDVRIFQGGGRFQVRVYVDLQEGGITLDRCTKAARTVGMLLEEADLFPGQYVIEVSSPGIRRPLRTLSHFAQVIGQKVDIKLVPGAGPKRVRGTLEAVQEQTLAVSLVPAPETEGEAELVEVSLDNVAEANLDPEFDAQSIINADRRKRKSDRREKRREKAKKGRKMRPKAGKTDNKGQVEKADPTSED